MKIIKGNLELKEDTTFEESITVEGNITCPNGRKNLKVAGNIDARDIDARDIDAWDIDAWNIDAWNIDARDIICVTRKKKSKDSKTIAYSITLDRFNRERKEVMPEKKAK